MAAVDDGGEVVGAALLPLPDTLGLLGLALAALDVDTGLVTHHQLGRVWKYQPRYYHRDTLSRSPA